MDQREIKNQVRKRYSRIAGGNDCCSGESNCCSNQQTGAKIGYSPQELNSEFAEANQGLGCGNPRAIADLNPGEVILDLGCGAGFDVFLARKEVGDYGKVIGVDMTPEMINKARRIARDQGYSNVEFRLGEIENLPVADNSVDIVISNCVINLSTDKPRVYQEIARVLTDRGRIAISDVLKKQEFPAAIKNNPKNYSSCVTGALSKKGLLTILENNKFQDIDLKEKENSDSIVNAWSKEYNLSKYIFSAEISAHL